MVVECETLRRTEAGANVKKNRLTTRRVRSNLHVTDEAVRSVDIVPRVYRNCVNIPTPTEAPNRAGAAQGVNLEL